MEVIPAIDLRNGRCVRLYQGRFDQETVFSEDPVAVALGWLALGAPRLHVIDLDGADKGKPVNTATIEAIVKSVSISVQVGGGLRDIEAVEATLAMGVQRVILGTAAVENPALVKEACARFGEAVVLAVDARDGYVATHGWKEKTRFLAKDFVNLMAAQGIKRIIYTDIAHDGTLTGPNFNAIAQLMASTDLPIIASGGIASIDHLKRLARLRVEGAIIGQALYTGQIDLKEAITAVNSPTKPNRHRFNVQNMGILEHPERKRELDPERVLDLLPLEPNQKIADIGCGPGYFTIPLSRRLGRGRVYALDVQAEMLERLRERVAEAKVKNIDIKLCQELVFPITPTSLDGVFLAFVLHENVGHEEAFLRAAKSLLKPGGWIGIVEWVKADMASGPPRADRIAQEEAKELAKRVGLKVVREEKLGEKYYFILFAPS